MRRHRHVATDLTEEAGNPKPPKGFWPLRESEEAGNHWLVLVLAAVHWFDNPTI